MPDYLRLDRASLGDAAGALRAAAAPLESVGLTEGFAFESATGVASAADEFLRAIAHTARQLAASSSASAQAMSCLADRGNEVDLQLAAAADAEWVQVMREAGKA